MSNEGKKVKVHYKGTFDDGEVFDSSYDTGEPIEFTCMAGQMIPGFDQAVADMAVGEKKTIHLEPDEAYGQKDPGLVQSIPLKDDPNADNIPSSGMVELVRDDGQRMIAEIIEKNDDAVVLDLNHPMAGKPLNFEIELIEVD